MGNYVRRRRFLDVWRIGETENWLADMAAQGLHLHSLGLFFAKFEKGEPENIRYRIDFSHQAQDTSEEQLELYAGSGWELVCDAGDMRVFRSPESLNAPEIHTDPAEHAFTLRKLSRRLLHSSVAVTVLVVGGIAMTSYAWFGGKTPVLSMIEGQMQTSGIMIALYVYLIFVSLQAALSTRKLVRSMREGRPLNHRAPWRRHKRVNLLWMVAMTLAFVVTVALPVKQYSVRRDEPLPLISDDQMMLRLSDIEQDPALERKESVYDGVDWANRLRYNWSVYAPMQVTVEESGVIPDQMWPDSSGLYSPALSVEYFKLALPWMADGLMADLAERIESWNEIHDEWYPLVEIRMQNADRALIRESGEFREVFVRKGNLVIYVRYYGLKGMDSVVAAVEALLKTISG